MRDYITYTIIKILSKGISFLSRTYSIKLAKSIGLLINKIFPKRKKVAEKNLKIAFPGKSQSKIEHVIKLTYQHYTILMFEFLRQRNLKAKNIKVNMDSITKDLLSSNKGLILMTAHLGNWEMIIPVLSQYKKSTVIVKAQRNSGGDRFLNEARNFKNITLLPMKASKRIMIDALVNDEVLALASDQNAGSRGIKVSFFGSQASIPKGGAYFHYKTKCPIVVGFCILKEDFSYDFKLRKIEIEENFDNTEDLFFSIHQRYSFLVEEEIKKNPEQYFWFHKKWDKKYYQ